MNFYKKVAQSNNYPASKNVLFFGIIISLIIIILLFSNFFFTRAQHFYFLTNSFLQGKLNLIDLPLITNSSVNDLVIFNNNYYWPQGPFPAILLLPFVYIGNLIKFSFWQGYLQFFLVLGIAYLVFRLSKLKNFSSQDSLFITLAFASSSFLGAAILPSSYHFSHIITVILLFIILIEYLTRQRYWLIGLLLSFVLATRPPASLFIVFFITQIFLDIKLTKKEKFNQLVKLITFPLIMGLLLMLYNYLRFYDIFEFGYSYQVLIFDTIAKAREYGLFSLIHLPGNLFYLLLNFPAPIFKDGLSHVLQFPYLKGDPWGMSIFLTSPILIYLFTFKYKDTISKILIITILLISLPILLYYGIGYEQFGYRYSLDFLPLLFYLFIYKYRDKYSNLSNGIKLLILFSAVINIYLLFSIFALNFILLFR